MSAGPVRALRLLLPLALGLTGCAPTRALPPLALPSEFAPDTVRSATVAPGVRHSYLWIGRGPWAVHLVEVDPRACGVDLRSAKAGERLVGRETTSAMARRAEDRAGRPVSIAINADFFSFEPPGVPEGPQVIDGEILKGQGGHREAVEDRRLRDQPVFGVTEAGRPFIADVALRGSLFASGGAEAAVQGVNVRPVDRPTLYTRLAGETTPTDTGVVEAIVRRLPSPDGSTARGVVVSVDTASEGVPLPPDRVVLAGRGSDAEFLRSHAAPGDTVRWSLSFEGAPDPIREMVGGFPMLLLRGESVLERVPELRPPFADARHPRAAVALRPGGTILLLAVDGRQPGYSDGMTLEEVRDFLHALGARDALNLDGGGSTTLVVRGAVVNRPSDPTGERPVANALLVLGPRPGQC